MQQTMHKKMTGEEFAALARTARGFGERGRLTLAEYAIQEAQRRVASAVLSACISTIGESDKSANTLFLRLHKALSED